MNEIETIFCKLFKCDRSSLYLDKESSPLNSSHYHRLEELLRKRINGVPLQYLIGDAEFMGLTLKVKPGVLIPRPETEVLVEEAVKIISGCSKNAVNVLDIGCGSGNISIALAKFLQSVVVYAVDISDICISVAKKNAVLNRVKEKIIFSRSDIFSTFNNNDIRFDFIVSNPPYIPVDEYKNLPRDVRREPLEALLAGKDGLLFYSRIEEGARRFLKTGGTIFLEIYAGKSKAIAEIFSDPCVWRDSRFLKDYNGIERVAVIKRV